MDTAIFVTDGVVDFNLALIPLVGQLFALVQGHLFLEIFCVFVVFDC
jgi:hypothetical protein